MIERLTGRHLEVALEATERIRAAITQAALRGMDWVDNAMDCFGEDEEDE